MNATTARKPTVATLKRWLVKNADKIVVLQESSFDPMSDCVTRCDGARWMPHDGPINLDDRNELGVKGLWLVGNSRDHIQEYSDAAGFVGYSVANCCGRSIVAVPPVGWAFVPDWLLPHYPVDPDADTMAADDAEPEPENVVPFNLSATPERPAYQDHHRRFVQQSLFATEGLFQLR